jgi:hypothetical protein
MKQHIFTMDLTPTGSSSCVLLDGEDISSLLAGVIVRSGVAQPTTVELICAKGKRAQLVVLLPEAQIVIRDA